MSYEPKAILADLLTHLGFTDATITEQKLEDGGLYFEVQCAESNRLIGRHGQTLGDLQYLANRIAFLSEGRIVAVGPPEAIRASQDPLVRRFLSADFTRD